MARFLADENVPADAVEAARQAGFDMAWVQEASPGADDEAVLSMSLAEGRVLMTFDKDFGEMAFRQGKNTTCDVILLRPRLRSPDYVSQFVVAVRNEQIDWEGHFAVAQEEKVRIVPLPA